MNHVLPQNIPWLKVTQMKGRLKSFLIFGIVMGSLALALSRQPLPEVFAAPDDRPANYVETIAGTDVTFEMIGVPGGVYQRGSPNQEVGRGDDEGPQHPVIIRPFWIGKCEVTWDEFDIYQEEMGVEDPKENDDKRKTDPDAITGPTPPYVDKNYGHPHKGHPAICMTHHAAMEYCRWLSKKTGKTYRLPTEAEWEYACRAGSTTAFCFGDDPNQLGEYAWYIKNSPTEKKINGGTHAVGTKKPNAWGIHDMHGNVMEWCLDHYQKNAYAAYMREKPTLNPVILPTEKRWSHVTRGGSWADEAPQCRSAARRGSDPSWMQHDPQQPKSIWWLTKFDVVGFRVVRAVEEQENLKGLKSKVTRESD
jgi:formylglycine-generating enzyme required for sulfatase activity